MYSNRSPKMFKKTISGIDLDLFSRKRSVLYSCHHVKDKRREK
jgi:hypothetical protein